MPELCAGLGLQSESQASNMIVTVKRRFRAVLKRRLRELSSSEAEAERELADVLEMLSSDGVG